MNKTIFLDIDGCLVEHSGSMVEQQEFPALLPGTLDKLVEWDRKGYKIILTTGRREGIRKQTEEMLRHHKIFYDVLLMGLPRGPRVVINDTKPDLGEPTAVGITLERNKGISEVNI